MQIELLKNYLYLYIATSPSFTRLPTPSLPILVPLLDFNLQSLFSILIGALVQHAFLCVK